MEEKTPPFSIFKEIPFYQVKIQDNFWNRCNELNNKAIYSQWEQLERVGTIDNFRIITGEKKKGVRKGFFYCDSDSHKWSEAAAINYQMTKDKYIEKLLNDYIQILENCQEPDGYLYTYNQIHFPDRRWANLLIEHELYSLGHMIEAAIAHFIATNSQNDKFLSLAKKSANLLVKVFSDVSPIKTPGHSEIEIALIRLFRLTNEAKYLELAEKFIKMRGRIPFFGLKLMKQNFNFRKHSKIIEKRKKNINKTTMKELIVEETNQRQKLNIFLFLRSFLIFLTGKYFQQNKPFIKMKNPIGHSVRWGYLATSASMLYQENGDEEIFSVLKKTWDHMVQKRMYVTGGLGSLSLIEGFGKDYELPNDTAYCETCAAISCILWNWEMLMITGNPKYSDLLEWQIYNAFLVGFGQDGESYFYQNLLKSDGIIKRKKWFKTPCCPPNISRVIGKIGKYIYSKSKFENTIWIHQYIGSITKFIFKRNSEKKAKKTTKNKVKLTMKSNFPWYGDCSLILELHKPRKFKIKFRKPSWADSMFIKINETEYPVKLKKYRSVESIQRFGGGFSPYNSEYISIEREWNNLDKVQIKFPMKIVIRKSSLKVKNNRRKIAISRGPIVYCLEKLDNPEIQVPNAIIDTFQNFSVEFKEDFIGGIIVLKGKDVNNNTLKFIPYYCWGNRSASKMQVWITNRG